jgi:choline-sulfatase
MRVIAVVLLSLLAAGCRGQAPPSPTSTSSGAAAPPAARNLVIITIDTLRADHVGAYGYGPARTPTMDRIAREGVKFVAAYATAPITLPSHASLMTGRYPAGHGARDNGMRVDLATPTIADALLRAGLSTAGFVAAYPLDRRFGLIKGFQTYGDRMPPRPTFSTASSGDRSREPEASANAGAVNERPGRSVVDEALTWLDRHRHERFFLWVHLFEPHAPYGNASDARRPMRQRYDDEVAEADAQAGRLIDGLGPARASTLVVLTADHGESFGEHGEIGHSIFVYDTTLRVPLLLSGAGVTAGRTIDAPVALIDIAPTVLRLLGVPPFEADGIDLGPALAGTPLAARELYAESFAPLLDFGWSPLRSIRSARWKYISAPTPELYELERDPGETIDRSRVEQARAAQLEAGVRRYSTPELASREVMDPEARARLQALGYTSGASAIPDGRRPDPKDRRALAARIAQVASGELRGEALERALRRIVSEDPQNPHANLRLGYVLLDSGRCTEAVGRFNAAIAAHVPSVDAHLGLAACETTSRRFEAAAAALRDAQRIEPGNPVVAANLGLVLSDSGHPADAVAPLERALTIDPDLHRARFGLAIALARAGRRREAADAASELLRRLPPQAPQRPEVERLLRQVR